MYRTQNAPMEKNKNFKYSSFFPMIDSGKIKDAIAINKQHPPKKGKNKGCSIIIQIIYSKSWILQGSSKISHPLGEVRTEALTLMERALVVARDLEDADHELFGNETEVAAVP